MRKKNIFTKHHISWIDRKVCVDKSMTAVVFPFVQCCVFISWHGWYSCSRCTARRRSWSSCWSSAGSDYCSAVTTPCQSVPGRSHAMSRRSCQHVAARRWLTRAKPSSQAWEKEKRWHEYRKFWWLFNAYFCVFCHCLLLYFQNIKKSISLCYVFIGPWFLSHHVLSLRMSLPSKE